MSEPKKLYTLKFTADELVSASGDTEISKALANKFRSLQREAQRDTFEKRVSSGLAIVYRLKPGTDTHADIVDIVKHAAELGRRPDRVFLPMAQFSTMAHGLKIPALADCFTLATPVGYVTVYRHTAADIEVHCR